MFKKQCHAFLPLFWGMWGGAKYTSAFSEEPFLNEKGVLVTEESCLTEKPLS